MFSALARRKWHTTPRHLRFWIRICMFWGFSGSRALSAAYYTTFIGFSVIRASMGKRHCTGLRNRWLDPAVFVGFHTPRRWGVPGFLRLPFLRPSKMNASSFKDDYLQTYSYCGRAKEGAWPWGCEGQHFDMRKRYLEIVKFWRSSTLQCVNLHNWSSGIPRNQSTRTIQIHLLLILWRHSDVLVLR